MILKKVKLVCELKKPHHTVFMFEGEEDQLVRLCINNDELNNELILEKEYVLTISPKN